MENLEITIDDRLWPKLSILVKHGTKVQTMDALYDNAATKFAPVVNNFLSQAMDRIIQRRKQK